MIVAPVEENAYEGEEHVEGVAKYAVYAVSYDKTVQGVGVLSRREVDVKTNGGNVLMNAGKDSVGVFEDKGEDRTERALGMRVADRREEGS